MQDDGWIVRNDNVWHKPAPIPDPVSDRCALAHEYVFHFVKQRKYYFNTKAVALPSNGKRKQNLHFLFGLCLQYPNKLLYITKSI